MENILPFPLPEEAPEPGLADEAALQDALEELAPHYPGWLFKKVKDPVTERVTKVLNPPAKPSVGAFQTWAKSDQDLFQMRLWRYLVDLQFYRQKNAGVWDLFRDGVDETVVSPEPTNQVNKLCAMIAGIPAKIRHACKSPEEQKAAYAVECWEYYLLQKWEQQHLQMGNGDLRHEMAFSAAIYGVMVGRVVPDPDDPDLPLKLDLLDPATCYWIPGDKWGLLRMTRVYQEPLGKVVDTYDPTGAKRLHKKLVDHYQRGREGGDTMLDYDREVQVTEVWTRWHRYVAVDDMKILLEAHEYGRVPFVVRLMPGEMGMSSTPETTPQIGGLTREEVLAGFGTTMSNGRAWDLAMKGHSFFHSMRYAVRYEEKILGLLMTQIKLDTWPPQITESPYPDDPDPVDLRPQGHTRRRPGEKTTPVQTNVRGQIIAPVVSRLQQFQQKSVLPDHLFGMVEGSNITGFAESSLIVAAKDVIQPYIDATEGFLEDMFELANYLFHGFANIYVDDPLGALTIPGRERMPAPPPPMPMPGMMGAPPPPAGGMPGIPGMMPPPGPGAGFGPGGVPGGMAAPPPALLNQYGAPLPPMGGMMGMNGGYGEEEPDPPEVDVDRDKLAMLGFRPSVELKKHSWQELTQIANVLGILKDKGFISKYTGSEWIGLEHPHLEQKKIKWELQEEMQMQAALAPPAPPALPPGPLNKGTPPGIQSVQGDSQPSLGPDRGPGRPGTLSGEDVGP